MKSKSFVLGLLEFILILSGSVVVQGVPQSVFLDEILNGRCYDNPVVGGDPNQCPAIVASLLESFSRKLDKDVRIDDFRAYLDQADFSSPPNGGLLIIGNEEFRVKGHVRPEDTAGGGLMTGLAFCAQDKRDNCPGVKPPSNSKNGEFTGVQSAFWAGVYQEFAKHVQGRLLIAALESDGDTTLPVKAAIPALVASAVTEVDLFLVHGDCATSTAVSDVKQALTKVGIANFSCIEDPYLLKMALCAGSLATQDSCKLAQQVVQRSDASLNQTNTAGTGDASNLEKNKSSTSNHTVAMSLIIVLGAALIVYLFEKYHTKNKHYDEIPHTDKLYQ